MSFLNNYTRSLGIGFFLLTSIASTTFACSGDPSNYTSAAECRSYNCEWTNNTCSS